ncbi:PDDEXK-like family protein [Nocardioides maradonensis]
MRRHAERVGIDHSHFTGTRRWTDGQLSEAIASSSSWAMVADRLGLMGGSATSTIQGHALRMGIDVAHLQSDAPIEPAAPVPSLTRLRRAAPMMAAAWFMLNGDEVSWPLEPCAFDLLVWRSGAAERVQVKTTTLRSHESWVASITRRDGPYLPSDIDSFFIIDGDLAYYWIPFAEVAGLKTITVGAYRKFKVGSSSLASAHLKSRED